MAGIVRKNLQLGGVFGALALLAACGGDDASNKQGGSFPLAGSSSQIGWPTEDPSFRNDGDYVADAGGSGEGALPDNWQPLRSARPMVASSGPRYDYAPSYDYRDDGPVYYDDRPNDDSYAWLALASTLGDTFGDAPPDYYFDYGDVEPWVWETDDHYVRYAEPLDDGYRYYYYEPDATRPYLIRDPDYSYGYRDDRLVAIYDDNGRVLDGRRAWHQRRAAANYYARARSMHQHWQDSPRYGVSAPLWNSRRDIVLREQRQWDRARDRQNGWRNWDSRNEGSIRSRWVGERAARQYASQRFDGWRRDDYRGVAPRFNVEARQAAPVRQAALRQEAIRNVRDRAEFRTAALQGDRGWDRGNWRNNGPQAILAGRRDQQRQQAFFDRATTNQRDNRGSAEDRQAQLRPRIEQRRDNPQRDTAQRSAFFANQGDGAREQALRNRAIQSRDNQGRNDMRERLLAQRQSTTRGQDDARRQAQASQAQDRRSAFAQRRVEAQQRVQQGGDRSRVIEQRQTAMRDRASQNQAEGRQRMLEQRQSQMRQRQQQAQQSQVEGRQRMIEQRQAQMQQRQAEGRQQMMRQRQEQSQQRQAEGRQRMMEQRQSQMQQRAQGAQQRQVEGRQQMMQQRQAQMQQRQQEMQQRASQRQVGPQQRPEARRPDNGKRWEGRAASSR